MHWNMPPDALPTADNIMAIALGIPLWVNSPMQAYNNNYCHRDYLSVGYT